MNLRRRSNPLRSTLVRLGVPAVVGTGVAAILARRRAGHATPIAPVPASTPAPAPRGPASAPQQTDADQRPDRPPESAPVSPNGDQSDRAEAQAPDANPEADAGSGPVAGVAEAARRGLRKAAEAVRSDPAGDDVKTAGNTWSCDCGQSFRVSGQGRHRVFWLADAEASDPVVGTTCPACDRPLPRSR